MEQSEIEALLGRDLTTVEVANLDLYLDIATDNLMDLLCSTFLGDEGSGDEPETRRYEAREGYSTVFTDIFYEVTSVSIDDEVVDEDKYEVRQFDNLNGDWFNSIVFENRFYRNKIVSVTGHYGFVTMPDDLKLLWARLFDLIDTQNGTDGRVRSQRIDDAQVTFSDSTVEQQFYRDNRSTIKKYSLCSVGMIRHGKVWKWKH